MICCDMFKSIASSGLVLLLACSPLTAKAKKKYQQPDTASLAPPGTPVSETRREHLESLEKRWAERVQVPQDTKIVGGVVAGAKEFPWAAALFSWNGANWRQYCGGSLIASRLVLTAAHCRVETTDIVVIGRSDLTTTGGEVHEIEAVRSHESYDPASHDSDIAVVRLKTPSKQTAVQLLGDDAATEAGETSTVIGWGHTNEGGPASEKLRKVQISFTEWDTCKRNYNDCAPDCPNPPWSITKNMLCAAESGRDSCQGDSGGGLLVYETGGPGGARGYRVAGIVSFGLGCARAKYPGVYTKISNYLKWVETAATTF